MSIIIFSIGIVIILTVATDLLLTTIQSSGAGFISGPISAGLWKLLKNLAGHRPQSTLLSYSGFIIVFTLLLFWVGAMWGGYFLLYMADAGSVIHSQTKLPADIWEKVYFSGFAISTLGIGDFIPGNNLYRVITALNALNGLILITMAITYLLPVLSAVNFRRQLAGFIADMGESPVSILKNSWDGKHFKYLEPFLEDLHPMLLEHTQKHLAYPVIHYFHHRHLSYSAPVSVVRLDEALSIARNIFPTEALSNPMMVNSVQLALSDYFSTLNKSFIHPANQPPDFAYHEDLIRDFSDVKFTMRRDFDKELYGRRKISMSLVKSDCWKWNNVLGKSV